MVTRIIFVRHAESVSNINKEMSCKIKDDPITSKGQLQAKQTAEYIASLNENIEEIYTSPMQRTRETAQYINSLLDVEITTDKALLEFNFGDLETQSQDETTWKEFFKIYDNWFLGQPHLKFPNGESYDDITDRIQQFLQKIINKDNGKTILVVSHGGIIQSVIRSFTSTNPSYVNNCSVSIINFSDDLDGDVELNVSYSHLTGFASDLITPALEIDNS